MNKQFLYSIKNKMLKDFSIRQIRYVIHTLYSNPQEDDYLFDTKKINITETIEKVMKANPTLSKNHLDIAEILLRKLCIIASVVITVIFIFSFLTDHIPFNVNYISILMLVVAVGGGLISGLYFTIGIIPLEKKKFFTT